MLTFMVIIHTVLIPPKAQLPTIVECQMQWLNAIWSLTSASGVRRFRFCALLRLNDFSGCYWPFDASISCSTSPNHPEMVGSVLF
jgi:hypothetical protein